MADIQAQLKANHDRGGHRLWQLTHDDHVIGHIMWGETQNSYEFVPLTATHFTAEQLARLAGFVRELDQGEDVT